MTGFCPRRKDFDDAHWAASQQWTLVRAWVSGAIRLVVLNSGLFRLLTQSGLRILVIVWPCGFVLASRRNCRNWGAVRQNAGNLFGKTWITERADELGTWPGA